MDIPQLPENPYEKAGLPPPQPGMAYSILPQAPIYFSDPFWYDTVGGSQLEQRQVFDPANSPEEQIRLVKEILRHMKEMQQDMLGDATNDQDYGYEVLFSATMRGSLALTKWIMKERETELGGPIDLSQGPPENDSSIAPLHAAATFGHLDVAKFLIEECRLPVDQRESSKRTSLMQAALRGNVELVRYLLEQGANPAATTRDRVQAPNDGSTDDEDSLKEDEYGVSVIDFAVRQGKMDTLLTVLDAQLANEGLPVTRQHAREQLKKQIHPFTIILATQSASEEVLSFLLKDCSYGTGLGEGTQATERGAIFDAMEYAPKSDTGSVAVARLLLDAVLPSDSEGKYLTSEDERLADGLAKGFKYSAPRGTPDIMRLYGAVLRDSCASTQAGNPEAFKQLVEIEAIHRCAFRESLESAKALLGEFGASPNKADPSNSYVTILDSTARAGDLENLEYFLSQGADIHLGRGEYANGPTPLWVVLQSRPTALNLDVIFLLLNHGGPVESKDEAVIGKTELHLIAGEGPRHPVHLVADPTDRRGSGSNSRAVNFKKEVTKEWLDRIQLRRIDEELARDGTNRPLQKPTDAAA